MGGRCTLEVLQDSAPLYLVSNSVIHKVYPIVAVFILQGYTSLSLINSHFIFNI